MYFIRRGAKTNSRAFLFCFFNGIQNTVRIIMSGKYILLLRGGKVWNPDPCACWASGCTTEIQPEPQTTMFW